MVKIINKKILSNEGMIYLIGQNYEKIFKLMNKNLSLLPPEIKHDLEKILEDFQDENITEEVFNKMSYKIYEYLERL